MTTTVIDWRDRASVVGLAECGGKGLNLARLSRAGFPVPPGFIITTAAYRQMAQAARLDSLLERLTGLTSDDPETLEREAARVREALESTPIPAPLRAELEQAATPYATVPVAVRSSATAEDLPGLSFAGQQDSYLNVVGPAQVLAAVVRCWGSLWTARAVGYRARAGINHREVTLAVVVQQLVTAQASGVMFTADPLTGRRDRIVLEATRGLGEALVSGQVEPDHYLLDHQGRLLERSLGAKAVTTVPLPGGGVETTPEQRAGWAIEAEQAAALARLGERIQAEYGEPQDVEWALADGELFVVQSRPITSLYPLPEPVDNADELSLYVSFGSFQGMLEPITPIGQEALITLFRGMPEAFGGRRPVSRALDALPLMRVAGERIWLRIDPVLRHPIGHRLLSRLQAAADPAVASIVAQLDEPRWQPGSFCLPRLPRAALTPLRLLPEMARALRDPAAARRRLEHACDQLVARCAAREHRSAAYPTAQARLTARLDSWEESLTEAVSALVPRFLPIMPVAVAAVAWLQHLGGVDSLETLRSLDGNVTTEMDLALWEVAARIRADAAARRLLAETDTEQLVAQLRTGSLPEVVQQGLTRFLERYGMRGTGEIDLGKPRWCDDPTPVIDSLRGYVTLPDDAETPDVAFRDGRTAAAAALRRLTNQLPRCQAAQARILARIIRGNFGARETPKFTLIRVLGVLRSGLLSSGADLVAAGRLDRADDVFFLHLGDLRQAWALGPDELRARVATNRQRYRVEQQRQQVPRVILGDGRTFYQGLGGDGDLTGSPVSPGVVEGPVRVVLSPSGAGLQPGEIMVCPGTDPSWTPLFLTAAGLITEVGGMMTHGSVVAREYGLPAVVGVHEATQRLRTGQRIRLDGSTGAITLLDDHRSPA